MFNKFIAILLISFSITTFHIDPIKAFKVENSKLVTNDETIDSFKSQTTIKQIC